MTLKNIIGKYRLNFTKTHFFSFLLSAILAWTFIIKIDLLGYSAATNQYSERLFFRIVGLTQWATDGLYGKDKVGQNNIAVILVDDKDIHAFGDKWPIPYFEHARVIKSIKKYKPTALFIDIGFWEKREGEGLQALQEQICALKDMGVPVYVAGEPPINSLEKDNPGSLVKCATALNVERFQNDADGLERTYLLSKDGQDSPALSLYKDYQARFHQKFDPVNFESPMKLFWVSRETPEINKLHSKEGCEPPNFSEIGNSFFGDRTSLWSNNCYYHKTLYASRLVESDGIAYSKQTLNDSLRNKIVIYGANITGSGDLIRIPTNNNAISGAYLHAMALDNLVTFGNHYKKDADWSPNVIFIIVCSLMYLFNLVKSEDDDEDKLDPVFIGRYRNYLLYWEEIGRRILSTGFSYLASKVWHGIGYFVKLGLIMGVTLALCIWQFICYDATPINWIELVTAVAFLEIIDSKVVRKNVERLCNWFNGILKEASNNQ